MTAPIPEFDLARAPPGKMTAPYIVGSSIDSPRSLSGISSAIDLSGGGFVAIKYSSLSLGNSRSPGAQTGLGYLAQIAAILNGGVRSILVPFLVDFWAPVLDASGTPILSPFSDGGTFSDTGLFSQPSGSSVAVLSASAAQNAGIVSMTLGGRLLRGGEWFEIAHPTRSSRAYCITDIYAGATNGDGTVAYTVGIRPPLREVAASGTGVRFDRPRCLMRLAPGTSITLDIEKDWWATPDVSFIESPGGG